MPKDKKQKNIPEGWREVRLGDIVNIYDGTHQTPQYVEKGIPFYSVEHISSNNFLDTKFISEDIYQREIKKVKIEKDDILMTRIGDVGTAKYINWDVKASFYVTLALIKNKSKDLNMKFLASLINSREFRGEVWKKTIHVAFPNKINLGDISKCKAAFPPLSEQKRIVGVLEVWDGYLEKLGKKIEIKKNIKKGLMQNLLTGKIRLKGFNEKWEIVKLGEVCEIGTGEKNNQDKIENGRYPFFVRSQNIERIDTYSYDGEAILLPGEGNIGKIFHYINGKFDYHQRVYKVSNFSKKVFGKYIYYYFTQNFLKQTTSHSVKATVDSLRLPTFKKFKILLPNIDEQKIIAKILTTADEEIENLEKKKKIIEEQRKYLLNSLITGKIRVPINN